MVSNIVIDSNLTSKAERWDQRFAAEPGSWFFGRTPSFMAQQVTALWNDLRPGETPTVLDLGCGEGRDAVWFARQGWPITAVDISIEGLKKTERLASEYGVTIAKLIHCDILRFLPTETYNIVFAGSSLHGLGEECMPCLSRLQEATPLGGLNAIRLMSTTAEGPEDVGHLYRVEPGELIAQYIGWRLLDTSENTVCILRTGRYHSFSELIAQKV